MERGCLEGLIVWFDGISAMPDSDQIPDRTEMTGCLERNDALIGAPGAAVDRHLLEALGADVRVVVCLRESAIVLECNNAGQRLELHRGRGVAAGR